MSGSRRHSGIEDEEGNGLSGVDDMPESINDPIPKSGRTSATTNGTRRRAIFIPLLGWKTEEDDFICVYAVKLPYLDSSSMLAPAARPDDGGIWLFVIRKEATKVHH